MMFINAYCTAHAGHEQTFLKVLQHLQCEKVWK